MTIQKHCDILIIGGGLAGLTLARQLLLETDRSVCIIDKSQELPISRQKYGESTVQVGGYYFGKVLELEHYLFHEHFMKYNLRFCFKTKGRENNDYSDYGQSFIRGFSNIPCYQINRNRFEADLLEMNSQSDRFSVFQGISDLEIDIPVSDVSATGLDYNAKPTYGVSSKQIAFTVQGERHRIDSEWVIDATGRGRVLARHREGSERSTIDHGAAFLWVDGTVDVENLTSLTVRERRNSTSHRSTGHLPHWLATNHFMGESFWFWVIPLRGKTSLGLVFDRTVLDVNSVSSAQLLLNWVCREFPLFSDDLQSRKVLDFNCLRSFSHSCKQTIDSSGWAITGESGRFLDPLYSPGSDFIALHNSLITEAIACRDDRSRSRKCWLYEQLMHSWFQSMLPSFSISYNALGDQETFALKYTWELSVYFAFITFPFINDFHKDNAFIARYLSRLSRLGPINNGLQRLICGYYDWKQQHASGLEIPQYYDFTQLESLRRAESTFYEVGIDADQARQVLDEQLINLTELANFLAAWIFSVVLDEARIVTNASFISSINFAKIKFDPDRMQQDWAPHRLSTEQYEWTFDSSVLNQFLVKQ
jgi:flavin-dependent dehydrogenase